MCASSKIDNYVLHVGTTVVEYEYYLSIVVVVQHMYRISTLHPGYLSKLEHSNRVNTEAFLYL
jgi:hypothetical protein